MKIISFSNFSPHRTVVYLWKFEASFGSWMFFLTPTCYGLRKKMLGVGNLFCGSWKAASVSECGGQTCCRNRNARAHHSSPPEPTLASDQVLHYLQALCAHAPGASWSQTCVPVGHDDICRWPAWPWETEILQQLPIWTSTVETKVRQTEFLVLRTEGMEFSSLQSPGTHKHWYFQKTVENSPF